MDFDSWDETPDAEASAKRAKRLRRSSNMLIAIGVVVAAIPLLTVAYGSVSQWALQRQWAEQLAANSVRQQRAAQGGYQSKVEDRVFAQEPIVSDAAFRASRKLPPTKIIIPKINVNQVIQEGSGPEVLKFGPGHYRGMALPGERGNVGIAGHRVTWSKPFNRLDELRPGDLIVLDTFDRRFEYRVALSKVLDPGDTSMLKPTLDARVTLTTCNPKFSARTRLDVQGVLVRTVDKSPRVVKVIERLKKSVQAAVGAGGEKRQGREDNFAARSELELAQAKVKENPKDAKLRLHVGVLYLSANQPVKAVSEFGRSISLNEKDPYAHYYLALASRKLKADDNFIAEMERSLRLAPELEPALYELGHFYLEKKEYATARNYFSRSVELAPLQTDGHFYLGFAEERLGRKAEARQQYRKTLEFDPSDERARAGLERLGGK